MGREAVAAGEGTFHTCNIFSARTNSKSSTNDPSGRTACARTPEPFHTVGHGYEDFAPTSDAEVRELLAGSAPSNEGGADPEGRSPRRS